MDADLSVFLGREDPEHLCESVSWIVNGDHRLAGIACALVGNDRRSLGPARFLQELGCFGEDDVALLGIRNVSCPSNLYLRVALYFASDQVGQFSQRFMHAFSPLDACVAFSRVHCLSSVRWFRRRFFLRFGAASSLCLTYFINGSERSFGTLEFFA